MQKTEIFKKENNTPQTSGKSFSYKSIGSWIAAIIILVIIFCRIDLGQFFDALRHANIYFFLLLIAMFVIIWFLLEAQNLMALLTYFGHKTSYREMLNIRGVTYLFMSVNYYMGAGGMTYYLKLYKGIPLLRGAGLMFFYTVATQLSLFVMSAIGCLFIFKRSPILNWILLFSIVSLFAYAIGYSLFKYLPVKGILKKLKELAVLGTFSESTLKTNCHMVFWRILYYSTFILLYYGGVKAFHMNIPIKVLAAYVPVILLIIGLPITPFGLGTVQAAMLVFFKDYGSDANILAFGIAYSTSIVIARSILGLMYVGKVTKNGIG